MRHIKSFRIIFLINCLYFLTLPFSLLPYGEKSSITISRVLGKGSSTTTKSRGQKTLDTWRQEMRANARKKPTLKPTLPTPDQAKTFKEYSAYDFSCHFRVDENSSVSDCIKIFEKYDMYKYDSFKAYIHPLPGYREFIHEFHKQLDDRDKLRKKMKNKHGHWFINHIDDEDDRTQREWKQEQQRINEDEQRAKAALEAELAAKYAMQTKWRQQNLENQKDQSQKDEMLIFALENEESVEHTALSNELSAIEESCEKFQMLRSFDEEFGHLADFCLEEIHEAYSCEDAENYTEYERHKTRAQAAHQTLREVFSKHQQDYDLHDNTHTHLSKLEIDSQSFTQFYGTILQHQLHHELVFTINEASCLMHAYADNLHIHNIVTLAYRTADQAHACNKKAQLREGFALSDFCSNVLEMGKRYAFVVAEGFDVCLSAAQEGCSILATGVGQGVEMSGRNIKDFLDKATSNPVRAISDFVNSTLNTSLALSRLFYFMLESPEEKGSEDIRNSILAFDDNIKSMSNHDRAVGAVALGTEMLLSIGAWEFAGAKLAPIANAIKEFSTIARGELALATHTTSKSPIALKLTAPITEMFGDALLGTKVALEGGKDFTQKAMNAIKKIPPFLEKEIKAAETIEEFATVQKVLNKKTLTELLKNATQCEGFPYQWEAIWNDFKIIFRDDTGLRAHAFRGTKLKKVEHFNIEIQKILRIKENVKKLSCKPFFKSHVIMDEAFEGKKYSGKFEGDYRNLNLLLKD